MAKVSKQLEAEVAQLNKDWAEAAELAATRGTKMQMLANSLDAANAELKTVREQFGDLKERLANAESETARLRGYLDRVHEDDIVRDGMVEIEDDNGKRSVPKRPPPMRATPITHHDLYENLGGRAGRKRTHWTSY